jgi:hypothetical protein
VSDHKSNTEIPVGSDRSFGVVFAIVFLLVAGYPLIGGGSLRVWALVVAAVIGVLAAIKPSWLHFPNVLWFKIGLALNWIVSPIVMGVIFFLTVTPIGLVRRATRPDPLRQKFDESLTSYWIARSEEAGEASSMRNQF